MKRITFLLAVFLIVFFARPICANIDSLLSEDKLINPAEIISCLESGEEKARVIVNLAEPANIKSTTDFSSIQSLKPLQAQIQELQISVISELNQNNFKLRHLFDNQAGFSCEVTADVLQELINDPRVISIEPVLILEAHLKQGIPLMNALAPRTKFNGQGLAVAICDTGTDYTHPMLGAGGFPNSKVIGGYDFGEDDDNPMPAGEAHGTACAGIAAGDLGSTGDYIGGVAYNAKLYALKICPDDSSSASTDNMIAAWDWCVTHKDDDPQNPIMVISTSFGGDRFFSSCDSVSPGMTQAATNAVSAGITLLASSGNDGFCDSMCWPACISNVISVGAVYDASFGDYYPCVDANSCATKYPTEDCPTGYYAVDKTKPDMVTSYSNTASFLDIFASSNQAYTTDIVGAGGYASGNYFDSFGGTSAACPYAAGAVACLQQAAKQLLGNYLSPDEVKGLLSYTGDHITDEKIGITKPRINLEAAIEQWGMDSYEPDNDPLEAKNILLNGDQQRHTIKPLGDVDWVKFNIVINSSVTIETSGSGNSDTFITLYDSQINRIAFSDNDGEGNYSKISLSLSPGLYYVKIEESGNNQEIDEYFISVLAKMHNPDIQADGIVNFVDYAELALWWLDSDCAAYDNCQNADIDEDGSVNTSDLVILLSEWLNYNSPGMTFVSIPDMDWMMSKYEATNEQYCIYLNIAYPDEIKVVNGIIYACNDVNNTNPYFDTYNYNSYSQIDFDGDEFAVRTKNDNYMANHPVVCVSWYGAMAFCDFYGYRLPTEEQWEAAAQGGLEDMSYPWGSEWDNLFGNCWNSHDSFENGRWPWTTPINYYPEQSNYYLNDIVGNVSEWTSSQCGNYKVLRGGSWYSFNDDCSVNTRIGSYPKNRFFHYGFRPAIGGSSD